MVIPNHLNYTAIYAEFQQKVSRRPPNFLDRRYHYSNINNRLSYH